MLLILDHVMLILPLRLQLRLLLRLHLLHYHRIWYSTNWPASAHLLVVCTRLLLPLHQLLDLTHGPMADLCPQVLDQLRRNSALISARLLQQLPHVLLVELVGALVVLLSVNWT